MSASETPLWGLVFFPALLVSTAAPITLLDPLPLPDVLSVFTGALALHFSSAFAGACLSHRADSWNHSYLPLLTPHIQAPRPWTGSLWVSLILPLLHILSCLPLINIMSHCNSLSPGLLPIHSPCCYYSDLSKSPPDHVTALLKTFPFLPIALRKIKSKLLNVAHKALLDQVSGVPSKPTQTLNASLCVSSSVVSDSFAAPWTVAHQAPLSMEFSRQEYWSG